MNKLSIFGLLLAMAICTSCGGGGGNSGGGGGGGGGGSIVVSVVPTVATVALNGTQQFSATVTPSGTAQTVTWAVAAGNGTTCSGATCGMVDANGLYTAPSTLPAGNPPFVIVTATSTADTTKSDSSTITLVSSQNNRVKGTYAFRFNGFNLAGPVVSVGNIVTDGGGNVTGGSIQISNSSGPLSLATISSGSYSIGVPQNSNLGSMKLVTSAGTFCYLMAVGSTTVDNPVLVQFDTTSAPYIACTGTVNGVGTHGSGLLNTANTSSFNNASVNQAYVFAMSGADASSKRTSYAGRFVGNGAGAITSWSLDINDGGTATSASGSTGTYNVTASGAGTMTLNVAGNPLNLTIYMKNKDEIFLTVIDPLITNPRAAGVAESQDAAQVYDKTTFNGTSIFYTTGVGSNPNNGNVAIGRANTDGNGNVNGVVDANNGGSITANTNYNGIYTATGSGRYTITINGVNYVMYAITKNKGFLLDQNSAAVLSGLMEPQTGSNFGTGTINGTFVQTSQQVSTGGAQDTVAALLLNGSNGNITGVQNETNGSENPNQNVAGTYTVSSSNGRGTYNLTSPASSSGVLYIITQSKFVVIPVDTSNMNPTVLVTGR